MERVHRNQTQRSRGGSSVFQAKSEPVKSPFVDRRPEARSHAAIAQMIRESPRVVAQAKRQEIIAAGSVAQLEALKEEEEPVQGKFTSHSGTDPVQRVESENRTGMPDSLKSGIESLSGMDMSAVRVHANSSKPASLNAHAYAQGTDIHLAPGQEKHLPHEAWHTVQQAQGRVNPTLQAHGVPINDNPGLEREADVMGAKAAQMKPEEEEPGHE